MYSVKVSDIIKGCITKNKPIFTVDYIPSEAVITSVIKHMFITSHCELLK